MNGYPSVKDFHQKVAYLANHVYDSTMVDIDMADPPRSSGYQWTRMLTEMQKLPNTPINTALMLACGHFFKNRPGSIDEARTILDLIAGTTNTLMQCLALHGKDSKGPEPLASSTLWPKPTFDWMEDTEILMKLGPKAVDGVSVVEQQFFGDRSRLPWPRLRFENILLYDTHVARTMRLDGTLVGHYVCQAHDNTLRILSWATRKTAQGDDTGLPEMMARDVCQVASDNGYDMLSYEVNQEHPLVLPPDAPISWRQRPALF